jgi:hypothetical protein
MSIATHEYRDIDTQSPARTRTGSRDFSRPANGLVEYRHHSEGFSTAPHQGGSGAGHSFGIAVATALLSALVVCGLAGLWNMKTGALTDGPAETAVVQVQEGESLADVAARVAPDLPVEQTVAQILDLNAMSTAGVHPGQSLITPTTVTP